MNCDCPPPDPPAEERSAEECAEEHPSAEENAAREADCPETVELTPEQHAKLDARLGEALGEAGDAADAGPFEVTVSFSGPIPNPEELASYGLARLGDLVLGRADRAAIALLTSREDVKSVSLMGSSMLR